MKFASDKQRRAVFASMSHKPVDGRSKKAIAIDKAKIAHKRYNPLQVEEWRKDKSHSDLMGYDAVISDPRSRKAIAIDRGKEAKHVIQLDNKKGYARWKKNRNKFDLQSWDTHFRKIREKIKVKQREHKARKQREIKEKIKSDKKVSRGKLRSVRKYLRVRKKKTHGITKGEKRSIQRYVKKVLGTSDAVDVSSLIDPSLTYRENKDIIRSVLYPSMREISSRV